MINWLTQENLDIFRQMMSYDKYTKYVQQLTAQDLRSEATKVFLGFNQDILRSSEPKTVSFQEAIDALIRLKLYPCEVKAVTTYGNYIMTQFDCRGLVCDINAVLGISTPKNSVNHTNAPAPVDGKLIFPYSTLTIDSAVYANRYDIQSVKLGTLTTSIGKYAFSHCSNLTEVEFSEYLTHIDDNAFEYTELRNAQIPASVRRIGENAFAYVQSLKNLSIEEGLEHIDDDAFFSCAGLGSLELPSSVKKLGTSAFALCSSLSTLNLGEVEVIKDNCFSMCRSLTEIRIPSTVKYLGDNFADGCVSLTDLYLPTSIDNLSVKSFNGLPKTCKIHIKGDETGSSPIVMYLYNSGYSYEVI